MENKVLTVKNMINAKNSQALIDGVTKSLEQIDEFVRFNEYKFKNDNNFAELKSYNVVDHINNLSLTKRKELRNYLWCIDNHPSLERVNRYLQFLMKYVLKSDTRYRIIKSDKQLAIEEKRKKYKEALAIVKQAHVDYNVEKGDYFKIRIAKGQKL